MPKIIINNFSGGLSPNSSKSGDNSMFAESRDVDIYRDIGYIMPSFAESNIVSSAGGTLAGLIRDVVFHPTSSSIYYATDGTKIYQVALYSTFSTTSPYPITFAGKELFIYALDGTDFLFCIGETDIGKITFGSPDAIDPDWLTTVCTSGAALTTGIPHPKVEWGSYVWVGNGRYLARLSGSTASGIWVPQKFDLGAGWEITSLFTPQNYIGICCWKKKSSYIARTESKVVFWDGSSDAMAYEIPIPDNYIDSSFNNDGDVYLLTRGRKGQQTIIRKLISNGSQIIRPLEIQISDVIKLFNVSYPNVMDTYNGQLLIGGTRSATGGYIFALGKPLASLPESFNTIFSSSAAAGTGDVIGCVKHLYFGYIYFSYYNGTNYYWSCFGSGNSANANNKWLYQDMGQNIRINYVKFYFKKLVSGDSITVGLDTDYGTTNSLGTITYSADGAITKKRFNKPIVCHAFRPTVTWSVGGVAIGKIIVDYDFITNDN